MKKFYKKELSIISIAITLAIVLLMAFLYFANANIDKTQLDARFNHSTVEGLSIERTDQSNTSAEKIVCEQDKEKERVCGACKKANVTYNNADCSSYTRTVDDENCVEGCVSSTSTVRTSVTVVP